MARLIDADALLEELPVHPDGGIRSVKDEGLMIRVRQTVRNAPTVGGWISVKDRLPKTEQKVIVSIKTHLGYRFTTIAAHVGYHERNSESDGWSLEDEIGWDEYDEGNDWYWVPECWYEVNIVDDNPNWIIDKVDGEITHWMPLPEPPEEVKRDDALCDAENQNSQFGRTEGKLERTDQAHRAETGC